MTIQQYQTIKQGGPFALVTAPSPKPGKNEVCIRPRAVSLNPIDWKNLLFGALVPSWPAVLGIEGAGIAESVGDGVASFKPGDEVMNWVQRSRFNGAFQEVYTAQEVAVAKKIGYLTAAGAIAIGLKVPFSGLSNADTTNEPPQSILVLGGSSGVGSAAIQLLRIALPSAAIITTSSVAHHAHLKSLGASTCLERAVQQDTAALKAATPGGAGVDAIIDAVGAGVEAPAVYGAFKSDGHKLYSLVITRPGVELPQGVQATYKEPGAMNYLSRLLEEGKYKLPLKIDMVGKGFQAIQSGLDKIPQHSGTKLVVSL
ncbi:hypothetical protein DL765_007230 [Monosporascus sp. GIB2]|nr:hypothetical protein DL765_007230 [Monosporascus sp. GIB2]